MPSGPPAFLTFIDFRSPCTRSNLIAGKGIRHLRGEGGGRKMPESSRVELEENRRPKRLAFSVGELATTIRLNKRRKGRFTKVVRDVFGKRPERFASRRTKKVNALSFDESSPCSSK